MGPAALRNPRPLDFPRQDECSSPHYAPPGPSPSHPNTPIIPSAPYIGSTGKPYSQAALFSVPPKSCRQSLLEGLLIIHEYSKETNCAYFSPTILPPAWSVFSCGSLTFLECLCGLDHGEYRFAKPKPPGQTGHPEELRGPGELFTHTRGYSLSSSCPGRVNVPQFSRGAENQR